MTKLRIINSFTERDRKKTKETKMTKITEVVF